MTIVRPSIVKQPSEAFPVSVDFAENLAQGETISTPTVTARNEKTGADSSAAVLRELTGVFARLATATLAAQAQRLFPFVPR